MIRSCSEALQGATIDAADYRRSLAESAAGDFIYLDPPYFSTRAAYGEYGYHGFGQADWANLLDIELPNLHERNVTFALSGPASMRPLFEARATHDGWSLTEVPVRYKAGGNAERRKDVELLCTNSLNSRIG